MKKIIKINDIVFVRKHTSWNVYSLCDSWWFKDVFTLLGRIRIDKENKYSFYPRIDDIGIKLRSIGENTLKTITSFIESQNKKLKYLGE